MSDHLKASAIRDLTGKIALVTGGGTGIGLVIAKTFAVHGATVYITGRRRDRLETAASEVKGESLVPIIMDVTDKDSITAAVHVVEEKSGKLDILVNNAGIYGPASLNDADFTTAVTYGESSFKKTTFQDWQNVLSTNTIAPYFVTMAFLGLLEKGAKTGSAGGTSSVINISSAAAHANLSLSSYAYAISKAGLDHITKIIATELGMRKIPIRVNAIAPGVFLSEMTPPKEVLDEMVQKPWPGTLKGIPATRIGWEQELAATALYFASSGGGYTTGAILVVDGGFSSVNP